MSDSESSRCALGISHTRNVARLFPISPFLCIVSVIRFRFPHIYSSSKFLCATAGAHDTTTTTTIPFPSTSIIMTDAAAPSSQSQPQSQTQPAAIRASASAFVPASQSASASDSAPDPSTLPRPLARRGGGRGGAGAGAGGGRGKSKRERGRGTGIDGDHSKNAATTGGEEASGSRPRGGERSNPGRGAGRGRGRGGGGRGGHSATPLNNSGESSEGPSEPTTSNSRRKQFGGKLSSAVKSNNEGDQVATKKPAVEIAPPPIDYSDLRSRLVAELSSGEYDCSICYSSIGHKAAIWSCSQCHTVLHLTCVKQWASSSVKAAEEQNAMQEDVRIRERKGTWRCPGCQLAREEVPTVYLCWDGQQQDPKPARRATPPHSCGKACTKSKCPHGCSAGLCHPGPCPPCPVTLHHRCFCGAQDIAVRCSQLAKSQTVTPAAPQSGISCGSTCNKLLDCGKHNCNLKCHAGDCDSCEQEVSEKCYCGKHTQKMRCGQGLRKISTVGDQVWEGAWQCQETCERSFACGHHSCQKPCHPLSFEPPTCPFSPNVVSTCPCGAEPRTQRTSCQDPIKTCGNVCGKEFSCGHMCRRKCHFGECAPCNVPVSAPCRCGESRPTLPCSQRTRNGTAGQDAVLCDVVCKSLRHCGRHECKRQCCPLAFMAKQSRKQGSRNRPPTQTELDEQDPARLHACPVPCAKPLSCGKEGHNCPLSCHRGPCPPCLQACFEDVACHCGRTVLEPPVPCGQRPRCRFPCARPAPQCGHPKLPHDCHEDGPCPPCVYLTTKQCDCGKNMVQNVPCHRQKVSCGAICGALKPCGFHKCTATCHQGAPSTCGACTALCGKSKRKCGHPCKDRCHAPAACDESKPCEEVITISCPCGHLKQKTRCGASTTTGDLSDRQLKCNEACAIAQRNARIAEALGLDPVQKAAPQSYDAELLAFYGSLADYRYAVELEGIFSEFIRSPRHSIILPSAARHQRKFTHDLAEVFGCTSESLDPEPQRSVQVRRTGESRVPKPLPSEVWEKAKKDHEAGLSSNPARPKAATTRLTSMRSSNATSAPPLNALLLEGVFGVEEQSLRELLTTGSASTPGAAPLRLVSFTIQWISDEDVVISTPQEPGAASSSRLLGAKNDVLRILRTNQAAKNVITCTFDHAIQRVVRREDRPGVGTGSSSLMSRAAASSPVGSGRNSPAVGHINGGASAGGSSSLSGWAAIASRAAAPAPTPQQQQQQQPASRHVWGPVTPSAGVEQRRSPNTAASPLPSVQPLTTSGRGYVPPHRAHMTAAEREATPDDWENGV